jgi:hypothetical protein
MLIILGAIATFFNIVIIIHKIRKKRFLDSGLDVLIFIGLCAVFSGVAGMQIGMIASMGVSLYLLAYPITLKGLLNG